MIEQEWRNWFAFILRKKIRNKRMTQYELAEFIGVDEFAISDYINAIRTPRVDVITNIAQILNCSTDELIQF